MGTFLCDHPGTGLHVGVISQYDAVSLTQSDQIAAFLSSARISFPSRSAVYLPPPHHLRCPVTDPVFWMIAFNGRVRPQTAWNQTERWKEQVASARSCCYSTLVNCLLIHSFVCSVLHFIQLFIQVFHLLPSYIMRPTKQELDKINYIFIMNTRNSCLFKLYKNNNNNNLRCVQNYPCIEITV